MIKTVAGWIQYSEPGTVQAGPGLNAGENHFGASAQNLSKHGRSGAR